MAIESRELMEHPLWRAYAASIERIRASDPGWLDRQGYPWRMAPGRDAWLQAAARDEQQLGIELDAQFEQLGLRITETVGDSGIYVALENRGN
jgi:hypothetical protein